MIGSAFVGRERELSTLRTALDDGAEGADVVVLVEGAPGIGKTRLLDEALAQHRSSPLVLRAAAREGERSTPFALLGRAVGGDVTARSVGTGDDDAIGAIIDLVEERASLAPVVVALEDVHWADHASVHGFWVLSRHVAHLPVVVLATFRSWPRTPVLDATVHQLIADGATHVRLGPLSAEAARTLLDGVATAAEVETAIASAGGNPLLVGELAAALRRRSGVARDLADGVDTRRLLLEPTTDLDSEAAALLRVAAALGSTVQVPELAAAMSCRVLDLVPAVVEAIDAGFLVDRGDRLEFRSPVLRDAIYESTPPDERAALHVRAARALAGAGAPAASVGTQLAAAGDPDAVPWLQRAAAELRSTAPVVAIDLLSSAVSLLGNDEARDRTTAGLVAPLARSGRVHEAITLGLELLGRGRLGHAELDVRAGLALAYERLGDRGEAAEQWTIAAALPDIEPERRASLVALAAYARLLEGDARRAGDLSADAESLGRRLGAAEATSIALTTRALLAGADGRVHEAVALAEEAVVLQAEAPLPWLGASTARHHLGLLLIDADQFDRAGTVLAEGRRAAGAQGSSSYLPFYYWELASRALLLGRLDEAGAEAEAGLALAEETGTRLGIARAHALLARVALHAGDAASAVRFVTTAEADTQRVGHQLGAELVAWTRALLLEADGETTRAVEVLTLAWEAAAPLRWFRSYRLLGPTLARLAMSVGDQPLAVSVASVVEEGARRSGLPAARGAALRAVGHARGDTASLVEATTHYAQGPRPLELAAAREEAGIALLAAGDRRRGADHLRAARALFEAHDATGDVARVRAALRDHGLRTVQQRTRSTSGWDALTPTERRVVGLVVQGLSNRRVAEELYLSRYTVETHLKHVFAKLGVSSRSELARRAQGVDLAV